MQEYPPFEPLPSDPPAEPAREPRTSRSARGLARLVGTAALTLGLLPSVASPS